MTSRGGNPFQACYINKMKREVMELREFETLEFLFKFFCKQGIPVEQQVAAYLGLVQDTIEEQLYFHQNHCYRANNYSKVCQTVYMDNQHMSGYVIALALTDCI